MAVATIAGRRLEVGFAGGRGDEIPELVFLHEGLGSVAMWRDFPERVAQATGRRALVYSRAGYGESEPIVAPRRVDYMHEEARVVLPALLAAFGVERPVLLGHSDGASIALIHAGEPAARPRGLVLLAPHVMVEPVGLASIERARHAWEEGDLRARLARYHADVDSAFRGWNDVWLHPDFRAWNIEDVLPRVRCPVLAIQGTDDEYGTMEQLDRIAAKVPDVERLELPACGHAPHRDRPDEVLAAVTAFVDRLFRS